MKLEAKVTMHNKFHLRLEDAKTGKCKQEAVAYNLVTNTYYNMLNSTSAFAMDEIALGTGVGTPAVTDTDLFHRIQSKSAALSDLTIISDTSFSRTVTATFTENEANGLLTEVCICDSAWHYWAMFSHAMLTDAEGHTITIEKTDTDRLTITATIYCSITLPQGILAEKPAPGSKLVLALPAEPYFQTSQTIPEGRAPYLWRRLLGTHPEKEIVLCEATKTSLGWSHGTTHTNLNPGVRMSMTRIQSSESNRSYTYQIKSIRTWFGVIPLPDANLFPPLDLEIEKVGDGTTTGFNFGVAELMPSVKVFIDNVEQDPSTYTWNGKDFNLRQAWVSQNGDYLIEHPEIEYSPRTLMNSPIIFYSTDGGHYTTSPRDFVYDFGTPRTINALRHSFYYYTNTIILYYSSDKTNWTEAVRMTGESGGWHVQTETFGPISARYWKIDLSKQVDIGDDYTEANRFMGAFDLLTNQLEFNNPPANGAVIKIQAKSAYPIKNSNWIVDQVVIDWYLTRGNA